MNYEKKSNVQSQKLWEVTAVGSKRSTVSAKDPHYFHQIREYRYGYETPFIPRLFEFETLKGRRVLEIGVGNGIDGVEMAKHGAIYYGLDITKNHLMLTEQNFKNHKLLCQLIEGDLLDIKFKEKFDVIYSFGVLHHIDHEDLYLKKLYDILEDKGSLRIAVYSKYSFFNFYLFFTWLLKGQKVPFNDWRSHFAEGSVWGNPVTIKIRKRAEVEALLNQSGFVVQKYYKRGFVQKYIPILGQFLNSDGLVLNFLGSILGWYHIFICGKKTQ